MLLFDASFLQPCYKVTVRVQIFVFFIIGRFTSLHYMYISYRKDSSARPLPFGLKQKELYHFPEIIDNLLPVGVTYLQIPSSYVKSSQDV